MRFRTAFLSSALLLVLSSKALANGENFDLGSTQASETATQHGVIMVNGRPQAVSPGMTLTPAQAVALSQVLSTNRQNLTIGALGAAVGGSAIIDAGASLSVFAVPKNVTVIGDFSTNGVLNVAGSMFNAGTLHAVSTNIANTSAKFFANAIENAASGSITSVLPRGGLEGFVNAAAGVSLSLESATSIVNAGTITSAASLDLATGSGNLTNSGLLSAISDVNIIQPSVERDLKVTNYGGIVMAGGSINVSNAQSGCTNSTVISGGLWNTPKLRIEAGTGKFDAAIEQVTGSVNVVAGVANISVARGDLSVGNIYIAGDPTFVTPGNYIISGDISVGDHLAIIAGGSILTSGGLAGALISTAVDGGRSGDINLFAGVDYLQTGSVVTILGGSGTGGRIDLTGVARISASPLESDSVTSTGGNITLVAIAGGSPNTGTINLDADSIIESHAGSLGNPDGWSNPVSGYITIIANGVTGTTSAISLGTVDNRVSSADGYSFGNSGPITIATAAPTFFTRVGASYVETSSIELTNGSLGLHYVYPGPNSALDVPTVDSSITTGSIYNDAVNSNASSPGILLAPGNSLNIRSGASIQAYQDVVITNGNSSKDLLVNLPSNEITSISSLWKGELRYYFGDYYTDREYEHGVHLFNNAGHGITFNTSGGGNAGLSFDGVTTIGGYVLTATSGPFGSERFAASYPRTFDAVNVSDNIAIIGPTQTLRVYADTINIGSKSVLTSVGDLEIVHPTNSTVLNTPSNQPFVLVAGGAIDLSGVSTIDLSGRTGDNRSVTFISGFRPSYDVSSGDLTLGPTEGLGSGVGLSSTTIRIVGSGAESGGRVFVGVDEGPNYNIRQAVRYGDFSNQGMSGAPDFTVDVRPNNSNFLPSPFFVNPPASAFYGGVVAGEGNIALGPVDLSSSSTNGGQLSLIASQNVTLGGPVNVSSVDGNAGSVHAIAGHSFTLIDDTPMDQIATQVTIGDVFGGAVSADGALNASSQNGIGGEVKFAGSGGSGFHNGRELRNNQTSLRAQIDVSSAESTPGLIQIFNAGSVQIVDAGIFDVRAKTLTAAIDSGTMRIVTGVPSIDFASDSFGSGQPFTFDVGTSGVGDTSSSSLTLHNTNFLAGAHQGNGGNIDLLTWNTSYYSGYGDGVRNINVDTSSVFGNAGNIRVIGDFRAENLSGCVFDASIHTVDGVAGTGNGGNIIVVGSRLFLGGSSFLSTSVNGDGGNISLVSARTVELPSLVDSSSVNGNGGHVTIAGIELYDNAPVMIRTSTQSSSASSTAGRVSLGGGIEIATDGESTRDGIFPAGNQSATAYGIAMSSSDIDTSSKAGTSGDVFGLAHFEPGSGYGGDGGSDTPQYGYANEQYAAYFNNINTSSETGIAGKVSVSSTRGVQVDGTINTVGQAVGGALTILGGSNWADGQLSAGADAAANLNGPAMTGWSDDSGSVNVNRAVTGANNGPSGNIVLAARNGFVRFNELDTSNPMVTGSPGSVSLIGELGIRGYTNSSQVIRTFRTGAQSGSLTMVGGYSFDITGTFEPALTATDFVKHEGAFTNSTAIDLQAADFTIAQTGGNVTNGNVNIISADAIQILSLNDVLINTSSPSGTAGDITVMGRQVDLTGALQADGQNGGAIRVHALAPSMDGITFSNSSLSGTVNGLSTPSLYSGYSSTTSEEFGNLRHTSNAPTSAIGANGGGTVSYESFLHLSATGTFDSREQTAFTAHLGDINISGSFQSASDVVVTSGMGGTTENGSTVNGDTSIQGTVNAGRNFVVNSSNGNTVVNATGTIGDSLLMSSTNGDISWNGAYTVGRLVDINAGSGSSLLGDAAPLTAVVGTSNNEFSEDPLIKSYRYTASDGTVRTLWNYSNVGIPGTTNISGRAVSGSGSITSFGDITITSTGFATNDSISLDDTAANPLMLLSYGGYVSLQAARTVDVRGGTLVSRWLPDLGRGGAISLYAGPIASNPFGSLVGSYFEAPSDAEFMQSHQGARFTGGLSVRNDEGSGPAASGLFWSRNCPTCTFAGNVRNSSLNSYGGLLALNDQTGTTVVANGVNFRPLVTQLSALVPPPPPPPVVPPPPPSPPPPPPPLPPTSPPPSTPPLTSKIETPTSATTPTDKISKGVLVGAEYKPPCTLVNLSPSNPNGKNHEKTGRPEQPTWLVASGSCQFCALDLDDPAIVMTGGTRLAHLGGRQFELAGGKVAVLSTKNPVSFKTKYGDVEVPANSATVLSQNEKGVVHVANLGTESEATFRPVGATEPIRVPSGQEVFVADSGVDDEELIPIDGMDRELVVMGSIRVADELKAPSKTLTAKTYKFNRGARVSSEPTLTCSGGCLSLPLKHKMMQLKNQLSSNPVSLPVAKKSSPFRPVSHMTVTSTLGKKHLAMLATMHTDAVEVKQISRDKIEFTRANCLKVSEGQALVIAKQDSVVECDNARVLLAKGSIAQIDKSHSMTRVRNLFDVHPNSVRVFFGKQWIHLAPGQECALGDTHERVTFGMTRDAIPRRAIRQKDVENGGACGTAEFSTLAVLMEDPLLSALSVSERGDDRDIMERILKIAACLTYSTGRHGPYSRPF